jgi:hypothetical protein
MQVSAFVRIANAAGDFAAILHKGDITSGAIMLVGLIRGANAQIYEKFPSLDGKSNWQSIDSGPPLTPQMVTELIAKRVKRDPDLWVIELDTADAERLNGLLNPGD